MEPSTALCAGSPAPGHGPSARTVPDESRAAQQKVLQDVNRARGQGAARAQHPPP